MTATLDPSERLAALHAQVFPRPWDAVAFRSFLASPGVVAICEESGFVLIRIVASDAEILTLAVSPDHRRRGIGHRLVQSAAREAAKQGADQLFLEVAADNAGAIALYDVCGFQPAGRRRAYYPRASGALVDALVLKKPLISRAVSPA